MSRIVPNRAGGAAGVVLLIASVISGCGLNTRGEGLQGDAGGTAGFGNAGGGTGGTVLDGSIDGADSGLPDGETPDVPCFPPNKQCGSGCADYDDPQFGCAQPLDRSDPCAPCPVPLHGVAVCRNSVCDFACETGWSDCDLNPTNGCETDITTVDDCDGCGNRCVPAHATPACTPGTGCGVAACDDFWDNCNGNPADGCEQDLRDRDNCGACGAPCQNQAATTYTCVTGSCQVDTCPEGFADCDKLSSNGCETDLHATSDCGACGKECAAANAVMGCADLGGGSWDCVITSCTAGFGDCDDQPGNGCEVDIQSNVNHCGSCGGACSSIQVETRTCQQGLCVPNCSDGFADCDGPEPGQGDDGCELPVSNDPRNCSACGNLCTAPPHATAVCTNGVCGFTCEPGWGDCTADPGCETNVTNTLSHCGSCNAACAAPPNATATCASGTCGVACLPNYGDCTAESGCETSTSEDELNCGACGAICSTNHASSICTSGSCVLTCEDPWDDCDGNVGTGCEANTDQDVAHCGGCGNACPTGLHATRTCSAGSCGLTCNAGWTDCDGTGGCECPTSGFSCVDGRCRCKNDDACRHGGRCLAGGRCACSGTICFVGQVCVTASKCG